MLEALAQPDSQVAGGVIALVFAGVAGSERRGAFRLADRERTTEILLNDRAAEFGVMPATNLSYSFG